MIEDREELFRLSDGTPVYYGDILWHPNRTGVGWYCVAEFKPKGDDLVTVRSPNGAVPTVRLSELMAEPPKPRPRCRICGQFLPICRDELT